jgi:hypothetical protein
VGVLLGPVLLGDVGQRRLGGSPCYLSGAIGTLCYLNRLKVLLDDCDQQSVARYEAASFVDLGQQLLVETQANLSDGH